MISAFGSVREFNNAELRAAVLNAFFTAVVTSKTGEMELADLEMEGAPKPTPRSSTEASDIRLGSGTIAYLAEGVSDRYAAMEQQWNQAGDEVRQIITSIRTSLATNDDIAQRALQQAGSHIPG